MSTDDYHEAMIAGWKSPTLANFFGWQDDFEVTGTADEECDANNSTSEDAKADKGKLKISLVPTQIIKDIAQVRMYGCEKYHDPNNWKNVEVERYIDALLRHTLAFVEDPCGLDSESGIEHYKHMACNMAFICEMMKDHKK